MRTPCLIVLVAACTTGGSPTSTVAARCADLDWQHSDYGQSGEIECDGGDVTEVTGGSDQPRGTYDAASMQLVWAGVTYAP